MSTLTPDQVVAFNLARARRLHGLTQEKAAERLEPFLGERWSRVVFSAAERSVVSGRIRQFNAGQLVAFAEAFDLPVSFFLTPPRNVDLVAARNATEGVTPDRLRKLATMPTAEREARVNALLGERYRELEDAGIRVSDVPAGIEQVRGHVVPDPDDAREFHADQQPKEHER